MTSIGTDHYRHPGPMMTFDSFDPDVKEVVTKLNDHISDLKLIELLRLIKNSMTGNVLIKEEWLDAGLLPAVKSILYRGYKALKDRQAYEDEIETIIMLGSSLVSSIAFAGVEFLAPIYYSDVIKILALLVNIDILHQKAILAAIQTLEHLASAVTHISEDSVISPSNFSDLVFRYLDLVSLHRIIRIGSYEKVQPSKSSESLITSALNLIGLLELTDDRRLSLGPYGLIDVVAMRVARWGVKTGFKAPGNDGFRKAHDLRDPVFPLEDHVPSISILKAAENLIGENRLLASMFLFSPGIVTVFGAGEYDKHTDDPESHEAEIQRRLPSLAAETILSLSKQSTHPTMLGRLISSQGTPASGLSQLNQMSSIFTFLLGAFRISRNAVERVMIASLLGTFTQTSCVAEKNTIIQISIIVLPGILEILGDALEPYKGIAKHYERLVDSNDSWFILEHTPYVITKIFGDSHAMGRAGAVLNIPETLSRVMEYAYAACDTTEIPRWTPIPASQRPAPDPSKSLSCITSCPKLQPQIVHKLIVRYSGLRAVASLGAVSEEYRKNLSQEYSVVPMIIESLSKYPSKCAHRDRPSDIVDDSKRTHNEQYGINTTNIIRAACNCIRVISRSVSILRTALVDFKVYEPLANLLKKDDESLVISAVMALSNMGVESSPHRQPLVEKYNIINTYSELTHRDNPDLRLESIWALRSFVDYSSQRIKLQVLDTLTPIWLLKLLSEDMEVEKYKASVKTNPPFHQEFDLIAEHREFGRYKLYSAMFNKGGLACSRKPLFKSFEGILCDITLEDIHPLRRAHFKDQAIQSTTLNFIRNLFGMSQDAEDQSDISSSLFSTPHPGIPSPITTFLETIGADKFVAILKKKLSPLDLSNFPLSASREPIYPTPTTAVSIFNILLHIAGHSEELRDEIMKWDIMPYCLPFLFSSDREPQSALCRLVYGLMESDDDVARGSEIADSVKERAKILRDIGYKDGLTRLVQGNSGVDVKESAKLARMQMKKVLD